MHVAKRENVNFQTSIFALVALLSPLFMPNPSRAEEPISRIAFGSCADQRKSQPIWNAVIAADPDLFVFLGDNVYADTEDMDEMRTAYSMLAKHEGFKKLRSACPIFATWDDHDYGVNDGGAEYPMREGAEEVFHEFFATPETAPSRNRPGIYDSHLFGPEGQCLQLIILDTRYFRGPLVPLPERAPEGPYDINSDPTATILGVAQWQWLEEELAKPADFRILATSIQFLPQDHRWERWENFPNERKRLLNLLANKKTGPVLFVSGDRHMGELMRLSTDDPNSPGFPVYEMTTSGLTNAGGGAAGEKNRHRISPTNFQKRNFGTVSIDWEKAEATMSLHGVSGDVVDTATFSWKEQ